MRSTLQAEIDQNLQDPEGSCYSFVCRGIVGDAIIPKNVCIRFIECTFSGITAEGNNILNFDNCTFTKDGNYYFTDGVVNINNCRIKQDITASSCKVYISNCEEEILGQIKLDNNSYGKSHQNRFNSENTSFTIENYSKLESYADSFSNNNKEIFVVKTKSYVKLSEASFSSTAELCFIDDSSEIQIYNLNLFIGQPNKAFANISNKSILKIHTIGKLDIKSSAIILNNSTCYLNNITDVLIKNSFIQATDSTVNISVVDSIRSTEEGPYVFEGKNSIINLYDVNKVFSDKSGCFYLEDTSLFYINKDKTSIIIANNGDVISADSTINTDKITIILNNFNTISSEKNRVFNLKNTSLKLNSINSIKGKKSSIYSIEKAKIVINDVDSIFSDTEDTIFLTQNENKLFLSNINRIENAAEAAININSGSLYAKGINNIAGNTTAIIAQDSVCVLEDIKEISGNNTGIFLAGSSSLTAENIEHIAGLSGKGIFALNTKGKIEILMSATGNIYGSERGIESLCDTTISGRIVPGGSSSKITTNSNEAAFFNSNIVVLSNIKVEKGIQISRSITTLNNVVVIGDIQAADSILNTNYCTLENLTASTTSVIVNNRSIYSGKQNIINSILNNLLTEVGGKISVSSGVLQNYISSPPSDILLENSGYFGLASSFNTLTLEGRSTYIGGATRIGNPGTINCGKSGPFTNPTGAFIVRSGDMVMSSDDSLLIETEILNVDTRNKVVFNTTVSHEIIVGTSSILIDTSKIELKAVSILTETVA